MNLYQKIIVEATGCSIETALKLEEIMRNNIFHSTLDWQTKEQLSEAALVAAEMYREICK